MSPTFVRCLVLCLFVSICQIAFATTPVVTVSSPGNNATSGSPVRYVAAATTDCPAGIAAMRIYSAPFTPAFTVNSNHLDTAINLSPGTYNTVVQAWDNCGGVGKTPVRVTVTQAPVVNVTAPTTNSVTSSPVHFTAFANSPSCAAGIAAMRIYTAPGVAAYTANANVISVDLNLAAGSYATVVQTWDKCGGVGKTPVNFTVSSVQVKAAKFLYVAEAQPAGVFGFVINPDTGTVSPNGQSLVATASTAGSVASDPGGYRLYVGELAGNVSAYFIDRRNGYLHPVPKSPVNTGNTISGIVVHPSGRWVFASHLNGGVSVLHVEDDGSLVKASGSPFPTVAGTNALTLDQSGRHLFVAEGVANASNVGQLIPSYIEAFGVDTLTGALTPLANSPYLMNPVSSACSVVPEDIVTVQGRYLYTANAYESAVSGYFIDPASGILTEMGGSPFLPLCADNNDVNNLNRPAAITVDPTGRFLYGANASAVTENVGFYGITGSGLVGTLAFLNNTAAGTNCGFTLKADPSGKFVYGIGNTVANCGGAPVVAAYAIDQSTGNITPIAMPPQILGAPFDLAVTP
jgi:6-phosphogluconolactonase (cycloisomerase 2 family)